MEFGTLDFERCYRAVASRDARFDGWFVTAVKSTGIYCRPSCPAVTPKRQNVSFLRSAAGAQREGFRACLRCRPDAAPGSPEWDTRRDAVGRAMRLIADGVVDRDGVPGLAARLGYTERHLHRMLHDELGAGPLALARAQRAQTARTLIETTDLGLADIAFAAGFGSVRQFNDTIREIYAQPPSALRRARGERTESIPGAISLRLPYREPLHVEALLNFVAARAIPGVEEVSGSPRKRGAPAERFRGAQVSGGAYRRILKLPHGPALAVLTPMPGYVRAELRLRDVRDLAPAVARCRRMFDLDADPVAVDATLAADPALTETIEKNPGVRVPRAADGFELAVRAIVGQQISVPAAGKVLARLCTGGEELDGLTGFPTPVELLALPDDAFRMPAARRGTLRALAEAVESGLVLDPGADPAEVQAALLALPGVGPWTAAYVAMRALGDPDVLLPGDIAIRRGAAALDLPTDPATLAEHAARHWAPWRSYATIHLWSES